MKGACCTDLEQEIERFFEGAKGGLDDLGEARLTRLRQETPRFFEGARQGLHVLRPVVIELDRYLARKFNFFCAIDFLGSISQKREDRMSDVLAYLLKSQETHGQQDLFLTAFLNHLRDNEETRSALNRILPDGSNGFQVRVTREAPTTHIEASKWIDIEICMHVEEGRAGIAIENKPWASDQDKQLSDYADHLESKYQGRFNLLYLTPNGDDPSCNSIKPEKREKLKAERKLANASIKDWTSDEGWLKRAEDGVKAERVRWFVSDFRTALKESLSSHG